MRIFPPYAVAAAVLLSATLSGMATAAAADTPTCDAIFNGNSIPTIDRAYNEAAFSKALAHELKRQETDNTPEYQALVRAKNAADDAETKANDAATQSTADAKAASDKADQAKKAFVAAEAAVQKAAADNVKHEQTSNAESDMNTIALGDTVSIEGEHLNLLFEKPCDRKKVVLFLNGRAMKGVVRDPLSNPKSEPLHFTLKRIDGAKEAWTAILGSPLSRDHHVDVSLGFEDGFALESTNPAATRMEFTVVPTFLFGVWVVLFIGLVAVFGYYAIYKNIIRDPGPAASGAPGVFSLSRVQGAWWFFVIVAAYLYIGTITGDFDNSINSTALILLGIGAGTVIGSAAIDAKGNTDKQKQEKIAAIGDVEQKINVAQTTIDGINTALKATNPAPSNAEKLNLRLDLAKQEEVQKRLETQLGLLQGESQGFVTDILSDANGISFHRFQMAAFTVILSVVFAYQVYETLAMPIFNTTLMGMMGLSAGTYLGLKIPEAKTPTS